MPTMPGHEGIIMPNHGMNVHAIEGEVVPTIANQEKTAETPRTTSGESEPGGQS
jgi:hypothetical protein